MVEERQKGGRSEGLVREERGKRCSMKGAKKSRDKTQSDRGRKAGIEGEVLVEEKMCRNQGAGRSTW